MQHWDRKSARRQLLGQIVVLMLLVIFVAVFWEKRQGLSVEGAALTLIEKRQIPLKEISGVASYTENGQTQLAFIGDSSPKVLIHVEGQEHKELSFGRSLLERFSLCQDPDFEECAKMIKKVTENWEAIARDAAGRFFLMQEHSQSIVVYDKAMQVIEGVLHYNFGDAFPDMIANGTKKFKKNTLGEGFVLLKNGHILLAKEKTPVAFVEFGPEGDKAMGLSKDTVLGPNDTFTMPTGDFHRRLRPLHAWVLSAHSKCDVSDLALDGTSRLLALSETCQSIMVFENLDPARDARESGILRLPREVKNPEALTVVGRDWMVGADKSAKSESNFYILRP